MTAPFIGRERELSQIDALYAEGYRLVTIVGPAGVGKTRLAKRFGECRACAFCDLSDVDDLAGMHEVLLRALGTSGGLAHSLEQLTGVTQRALQNFEGLIILDNLEQLASDGAETVAEWLDLLNRNDRARLLATSRERLRLNREAVLNLEPLSVPAPEIARPEDIEQFEAVRLLVSRIGALGISGLGMKDAARIVRAVEGFPLALELAVPRLRVLSADELVGALEHPLDLLTFGARDAPAHHASIERALAGSWRLLRTRAQHAFAMLACFRGAFSARDAEHILGDEAFTLLTELCEASLIFSGDGPAARKFRMYLAVRSFAELKAKELGIGHEACLRHARWFAQLSQTNNQADLDPGNLIAVISRALETPEAELMYCAAHAVIALHRDHKRWDLSLRWLDAVAASQQTLSLDAELRNALKLTRAGALHERGRYRDCLSELDEAALSTSDVLAQADIEVSRASTLLRLERLDEARRAAERALVMAEGHGLEVHALLALASIDLHLGKIEAALLTYRRLQERALLLGDERLTAMALGYEGHALQESGDLMQARRNYVAAAALFEKLSDARLSAIYEGYEGCALHEAGELELARSSYERATSKLIAVEAKQFAGLFSACHAALCAANKRLADAQQLFLRAAELTTSTDAPAFQAALALHQKQLWITRAHLDLAHTPRQWLSRHSRAFSELLTLRRPVDDDARFAMRLLVRARDELRQAVERAGLVRATLIIGDAWIETASGRVELNSRKVLWRILEVLVQARLEHPGAPVLRERLLRAGWGDERMEPAAAAHRLRVALSELRTKGLNDWLERAGSGYRISPSVEIQTQI